MDGRAKLLGLLHARPRRRIPRLAGVLASTFRGESCLLWFALLDARELYLLRGGLTNFHVVAGGRRHQVVRIRVYVELGLVIEGNSRRVAQSIIFGLPHDGMGREVSRLSLHCPDTFPVVRHDGHFILALLFL